MCVYIFYLDRCTHESIILLYGLDMHDQCMIHTDIKTANVVLVDNTTICVREFNEEKKFRDKVESLFSLTYLCHRSHVCVDAVA